MRNVLQVLLFVSMMAFASCGRNNSARHIPNLGDTPYQEDSVLVAYGYHPDRALVMLDSALLLGNINEYRAKFTRAKIYSKSLLKQRQDSAILICEQLLKHDSVINTLHEQENILDLLMITSRTKTDIEGYVKWATQKVEVCRLLGEDTEEWRTEAEIGMMMAHLGQPEEGMSKIDEAIRKLDAPGSIDRMDAFIIAVKRKITVLNDQGRHAEVIPLAQRILDRLDHYEQHAKDYAEDSYRLSWSDKPADRDRYIDFSRAQAKGFLAGAYAMTGDAIHARECLARFDQSGYGHSFSARRMIIPTQMALGMYDEAMATCDEIVYRMGNDTVNDDYAVILRDRAIVARAKGRLAEAYNLMNRHANLAKVLSDSLHASEAHDYTARYHAKEQELKIQEAETASRIKSIIICVFVLLFIITGVVSFYYRRQRQIISEKNRALVRMINGTPLVAPADETEGAEETDEVSESEEPESNSALFDTIDTAIRTEHLYANVSLQRQDICTRFCINRHTLNNMLAKHVGSSSFPQYINNIRMKEVLPLLRDNPSMTITAIAAAVGFTPANFREQFKRQYGVTPQEYRQNL
ncbi:MAG: helix-turn-helix domain-containing protein [Prevotella sp.]|nr:helix-turn-helix domain-containing protein [Prevotella sp.]